MSVGAFLAFDKPTLTSPLGTFTPAYVGTTGRLASLTYPNGQTATYTYLPVAQDLRLQTIHHRTSGGTTLSRFDYTYDVVENILTWRQERQGQTPFRYTFTHDAADQLLTALKTTTDVTPTVLARQAWAYDRGGNRTVAQSDDQVLAASHDSLNRLISRQPGGPLVFSGTLNEAATVLVAGQPAAVDATHGFRSVAPTAAGTTTVRVQATDTSGNVATQDYEVDVAGQTTTYTYDANGNLTGDGMKTYVWNARNQLVKVLQGGADVAVFTYDGAGRRVTKAAGGVTHTYIYDGPDILEERLSGGDVIRYIHGPGIDNVLARTTNGADAAYYAADHLGSIVHETDGGQAVTLTRRYDSWGNLEEGATASGFSFTGREWDYEAGVYYYRARYYSPATGRFLSEDPNGLEDGSNRFGYVSARPTVTTDPSGRLGFLLGLLAPAGSAATAAAQAATAVIAAATMVTVAATIENLVSLVKPPTDAYDPNGAKAPGKPGPETGFADPKGGENWVPNPNGRGHGWESDRGDVWVPTGPRGHGGPHWDVQTPGRQERYRNVYPPKTTCP